MIEEFKKYLVSTCRCDLPSKFLVAVSGGVDSVVMAHLFYKADLNFSIAHCNFQLRGKESDADQEFVEAMASKMHKPFYVRKFNTTEYADNFGISIQMAARDMRYRWFEEIAEHHGYNHIVIAHNKNDIIETVFLNLTRGTGLRGLMGIKPVNNQIVRPLLFASRQMINAYANEQALLWRDDSSNSETKYHRNKIRHTIIPALESINPAFIRNTLNTIKRIEQTGKLIDLLMEQVKASVLVEGEDKVLINITRLKQFPAHEILLFELLREFNISHLSEEMLLNTIESNTGKQFHTSTHTLTRDRDNLIVTERKLMAIQEISIASDTTSITDPIKLTFSRHNHNPGFKLPKDRNIAVLDAEKLEFPLILRGWKDGDKFRPLGLKGSKKVSDFLINIKLSLPEKKKIRILESNGKIVWLVNHRIDDRFKVTDETTEILRIEYGL
jgi:tRNA(Ile)-lysidine synthase